MKDRVAALGLYPFSLLTNVAFNMVNGIQNRYIFTEDNLRSESISHPILKGYFERKLVTQSWSK